MTSTAPAGGLELLAFRFDRADLLARARALHDDFRTGDPFPHIVIDGLIPDEVLDGVLEEFPEPGGAGWEQFDKPTELKLALADAEQMSPVTRHLLAELDGQVFVEFLETLTGIDGLIPDPHHVGGGLHQILPGGFLKVHADFNRHPRLRLDRRLNALVYLNRDWPDSYGGHLELWDAAMTGCARRVLPVFNRMVIFATTDFANHGHPDPLGCPPGRARRSLALYYYSNGRPREELAPDHTTLFQSRPGERFRLGGNPRDALRRWVPPALADRTRGRRRRTR